MSNDDEYIDIYSPYYQPEEEPSSQDVFFESPNLEGIGDWFTSESPIYPEYQDQYEDYYFRHEEEMPAIVEGMGEIETPSFLTNLLKSASTIIPSFFSATLAKIFPETEQANPSQETPSEARYLKPYSTMKGAIQASYETLTKSLPSGIFIYVIIGAIGLFLFFFLKKR